MCSQETVDKVIEIESSCDQPINGGDPDLLAKEKNTPTFLMQFFNNSNPSMSVIPQEILSNLFNIFLLFDRAFICTVRSEDTGTHGPGTEGYFFLSKGSPFRN